MADGERSTSSVGGDEQRHPCDGEVRDHEEQPQSKKSRNEQKRKKLEKRKRVEEDSRLRETVKMNKEKFQDYLYREGERLRQQDRAAMGKNQ